MNTSQNLQKLNKNLLQSWKKTFRRLNKSIELSKMIRIKSDLNPPLRENRLIILNLKFQGT